MKKNIFILGGARSGKSKYAVELAKKRAKKVIFIATATFLDTEMKKRIRLHKASRPRRWKLIREGKDISAILPSLEDKYKLALIDCLGVLISNLLADGLTDKKIEKNIERLVYAISKTRLDVIIVSNDVGGGIVPDNSLGRRFRDLLGFSNQVMTRIADEVIFMQAGIPLTLKKGLRNEEIE